MVRQSEHTATTWRLALWIGTLWILASPPSRFFAQAPCAGDCNGDSVVTVNEIVTLVRIVLNEAPPSACGPGDADGDRRVMVNEIVLSVNNLLNNCGSSCGNRIVEGNEQCDDGGTCLGTAKTGSFCATDQECWTPNDAWKGVCQGGATPYRFCNRHADCPNGRCVACWTFGGDGCSAACTRENSHRFEFRFASETTASLPPLPSHSAFDAVVAGPLATTGSMDLIVGDEHLGRRPLVVPAASVRFDATPVSTLVCACLRATEYRTCGGALFFPDGRLVESCTMGFASAPAECPQNRPCASVFGPGNAATGTGGCRSLDPANFQGRLDCDTGTNAYQLTTEGGPGAVVMATALAFGGVSGQCSPTFCSEADPPEFRGVPAPTIFTTGTACASGCALPGPECQAGQPVSCPQLGSGDFSGLAFCTATGGLVPSGQEFLATGCMSGR